MPFQLDQQLPYGSIMRDGIGHGHESLEPNDSILVTMHHGSLIRSLAARVLHIIKPLAIRLPDINLDTFNWFSECIFEGAENETGLAIRIMGNLRAIRVWLGLVGVKWS